ncbi:hypothetical protein [Kiloniella laminariae]|nr:hypothetical protein [Kiloniella laminariae]
MSNSFTSYCIRRHAEAVKIITDTTTTAQLRATAWRFLKQYRNDERLPS